MRDNGILAMQYKLLCKMQDWSRRDGPLVSRVDEEGKVMLPNEETKPCKPISMKNVEDIIKDKLGFVRQTLDL